MAMTLKILEKRRKDVEDLVEVLVMLDQVLFVSDGAPYVLERHEQMELRMAAARKKIELLDQQLVTMRRRAAAKDKLARDAGAVRQAQAGDL